MDKRIDWERSLPVIENAHNVLAAWTFGSAKNGELRPGSDADIGVLFGGHPSLDELTALRDDLQVALPFDEIDVVV